jgi:hypothetical protein
VSVRRLLAIALVAAFGLVAAACVGGARGSSPSVSPSVSPPSVEPSPSPVPTGSGSAAAALRQLCDYGGTPSGQPTPPEGPTPPVIARVEKNVQDLRDLRFTDPVVADPVTHDELVQGLESSFADYYPKDLYARKSLAWQTIGVIPEGTDLREQIHTFSSGQVIGYYDSFSKELVFIGTENPSPFQQVTLAHELTHALDDQNFGLGRLDQLSRTCQDEPAEAALAVVEGDATFTMTQYALQDLSAEEQLRFAAEAVQAAGTPSGVVPFVADLEAWPYNAGLAFMQTQYQQGGNDAIDRSLRSFPVSTEQILHPEKYPTDVPTPVDIPDLGPALGAGWQDLDVQQVGEAWLWLALDLRMDSGDAAQAAAGWDGGIYRAWSNGNEVAVVMSTVWDTPDDARAFADAMGGWIDTAPGGQAAQVLPVEGNAVRVLFASDAATLDALRGAAS